MTKNSGHYILVEHSFLKSICTTLRREGDYYIGTVKHKVHSDDGPKRKRKRYVLFKHTFR